MEEPSSCYYNPWDWRLTSTGQGRGNTTPRVCPYDALLKLAWSTKRTSLVMSVQESSIHGFAAWTQLSWWTTDCLSLEDPMVQDWYHFGSLCAWVPWDHIWACLQPMTKEVLQTDKEKTEMGLNLFCSQVVDMKTLKRGSLLAFLRNHYCSCQGILQLSPLSMGHHHQPSPLPPSLMWLLGDNRLTSVFLFAVC